MIDNTFIRFDPLSSKTIDLKIQEADVMGWLGTIYEITKEEDLDTALDLCYSYNLTKNQSTSVTLVTLLIDQIASSKLKPPIVLPEEYLKIARGNIQTINPISGLPCDYAVRMAFGKRVADIRAFYVGHMGLNGLKEYEKEHGVEKRDKILNLTASLLSGQCGDNFIGHVGTYDFVLFLPVETAEPILKGIAAEFDGKALTYGENGSSSPMTVFMAVTMIDKEIGFDRVNATLISFKEHLADESRSRKASIYAFDKRKL